MGQAISGWAGWIDVERHADLKSITARRLYQLCAAHAARHVRLPWVLPEHELRTACMLTLDGKQILRSPTDAGLEGNHTLRKQTLDAGRTLNGTHRAQS